MFNSYVQEKRLHTASVSSRRQLALVKDAEQGGQLRNELALRYKQRLDQELVKVGHIQLALNTSAPDKGKDAHTSKLLGEAKFRIQGHRTTLERLEESAQERAILDTSASHAPIFVLRERRKDLEIGTSLRFGAKTQAERLFDAVKAQVRYTPQPKTYSEMRTQSASRVLLPEYHHKTHYKTILSLEMNLHTWQQGTFYVGPKEQTLREQVRQEKLGKVDMQPRTDKPLLKHPIDTSLSLLDNLRNAPSADHLVLTQEQKKRLTEEIVRNTELKAVRRSNVTPLRSRIGSSPTTYSGFLRGVSLSPSRKTYERKLMS